MSARTIITRAAALTSIALAIVIAVVSPTPKPDGALLAAMFFGALGVLLACSRAAMPRGGVR